MFALALRGLIIAALVESTSCFVPAAASRPGSAVARAARGSDTAPPSTLRRAITPRPSRVDRPRRLSMVEKLGPDETVKKYGLEAGLFKALKEGNKQDAGDDAEGGGATGAATTAKDLLKKYGSAYLITSIALSLVSFGTCYVAVSNGVDMASVLGKVGIETSASAETTGTVALAYAIHKAASPIRFPPTVALTPVVANLFGKGDAETGDE